MKKTPEQFIEWIAPAAVKICSRYGLYPSVCIAQAAIESTWGADVIEAEPGDINSGRATGFGGANFFGRKAVSSDPLKKWEWTTENGGPDAYTEDEDHIYLGVHRWRIKAWFKLYPSMEEAVEDYCILLTEEPAYATVMAELGCRTQFVYALAGDGMSAGVYATNKNYGPDILATIRANDLDQYDKGEI